MLDTWTTNQGMDIQRGSIAPIRLRLSPISQNYICPSFASFTMDVVALENQSINYLSIRPQSPTPSFQSVDFCSSTSLPLCILDFDILFILPIRISHVFDPSTASQAFDLCVPSSSRHAGSFGNGGLAGLLSCSMDGGARRVGRSRFCVAIACRVGAGRVGGRVERGVGSGRHCCC